MCINLELSFLSSNEQLFKSIPDICSSSQRLDPRGSMGKVSHPSLLCAVSICSWWHLTHWVNTPASGREGPSIWRELQNSLTHTHTCCWSTHTHTCCWSTQNTRQRRVELKCSQGDLPLPVGFCCRYMWKVRDSTDMCCRLVQLVDHPLGMKRQVRSYIPGEVRVDTVIFLCEGGGYRRW